MCYLGETSLKAKFGAWPSPWVGYFPPWTNRTLVLSHWPITRCKASTQIPKQIQYFCGWWWLPHHQHWPSSLCWCQGRGHHWVRSGLLSSPTKASVIHTMSIASWDWSYALICHSVAAPGRTSCHDIICISGWVIAQKRLWLPNVFDLFSLPDKYLE